MKLGRSLVIAIFTVLLSLFLVFLVVENTFMFNKSYTNAQKFVLNVPYVKQKPNFCSEASASMVLKYYDYNVSQDEINRMGYDRFENMLPLLKRYVNCTYKSLSIDELQEEIRKNNPVIIRVRAGVSLHTVVVVGYEDDCLLIHDPALGPYIPIKLSLGESFIRAWASTNYSSIIFFEKKQ